LKVGDPFDPRKLDAVTEKLGKSGAFEQVSYSYRPEGGLMVVEFTVQEAARFHKCVFDNFVWAGDEEIEARLRKDNTLYTGLAPESGDLLDDIAHSLESLLREKGITAQVTRIQEGALGDPNWVHLFTANGPVVKVASVAFKGAPPENQKQLGREAAPLVGRAYSRLQCGLYAANAFMSFYRERGYLRVDLGTPSARLLGQAAGTNEFAVEVNYAVTEGAVYKWTPAEWSGAQSIAPSALENLMGLKPDEIANGKKIDDGWQAVKKEYGKLGYVAARISADPAFDDASSHVRYRVSVTEGPLFHMGSFQVQGVPPEIADRLTRKWRLKPGDVFDTSYLDEFSKKDAASVIQSAFKAGAKPTFTSIPDREQHIVNVIFRVQ